MTGGNYISIIYDVIKHRFSRCVFSLLKDTKEYYSYGIE